MIEERETNIMLVELAIQRELAYRKKVASYLSEKEIADLLPLKPTNATIKYDQASHRELDGWKLVKLEEEGEGIPYPTRNIDRASLPALKRPKPGMQSEKGEGVPPSSTFRNPDPRPAQVVGQSSMSVTKPGTNPYSISSTTIAAVNGVPMSVPNLKPSPAPTENQRASQIGIPMYPASTQSETARRASTSSLNCLPEPRPHPYVASNGLDVFCYICKMDCSNPFNYKQHLRGHKHRAKLQFMQLRKNAADPAGKQRKQKPRCDLCEIWCTDENSLQFHFHGQKHKAKLLDAQLGQKQKAP